ncbi:hypothetical protein BH11ACT6_BH11ACT6_37570 [soil metagenome]
MGAGACIALGAGPGIALADTDSSDGSGATSQSQDRDSAPPERESKSTEAARDRDAATDPSSSSSTPAKATSVATLQRETAKRDRDTSDDDAAEATETDTDTGKHSTIRKRAPPVEDAAPADSATVDETPAATPVQSTPSDSVATPVPDSLETTTTAPTPPVAVTKPRTPGPVASLVLNLLSNFGWSPRPEAVAAIPAPAIAPAASSVTGVQTGHSALTIPLGTGGYTTRADWYFPTQADGSVSATGVIWLQHGFLSDKSWYSALAKSLSQQTNSIVVAPNLPSFPLFCSGCSLNDAAIQQGAATMFLGDQAALNASAIAAGYQGTLPESFILAGHSAGGGFAAAVAGYYASDPNNERRLRGVVMFDGVARDGVLQKALQSLDDPAIPIYQIAAPPQAWNAFGATTAELVAARAGQFVGVTLAGGSHVDSLVGANPIIDFFLQLVTRFSPPGNTAAVYTLASGWINDLYQGLGPTDGTGIYGAPDQYIVLGNAAAVVLAPAPTVELDRYLGTWYEVGSVKQFFSLGLVNTTAVYSLNPDGSIKVVNSGNYFVNNGPKSSIVGVALPVNATNNKLNVSFFGFPASAKPPGNYWIVDLDPDYQWAIVSDSTGFSGFLLTRTPVISDELYRELLNRASVKGVKGWITRTRQPAGEAASITV